MVAEEQNDPKKTYCHVCGQPLPAEAEKPSGSARSSYKVVYGTPLPREPVPKKMVALSYPLGETKEP